MQFSQQQHPHDESDRKNRFLVPSKQETSGPGSLRERAASQPPHTDPQPFLSSPSQLHTSLSGTASSHWSSRMHPFNTTSRTGALPSSVPTRSSSFSNPQSNFASAMRESRFASTVEDDESEALSDTYDEHYTGPSVPSARGRSYASDLTRSRSQSLAATTRPGPIASPFQNQALWSDVSSLHTNALNIPGSRYGDIKPPGSSRYGSLGTMGRSPLSNNFDSHIGGANGYSNRQTIDASNMSPFVRDVGQILLDDGSALRQLWAGMNPPKDESGGGGGSGTTSRRHSVSVVQPRRPIVGFNAPGNDPQDESSRPNVFHGQTFGGRGGLMLSDDDLAADLNSLSVKDGPGPSSSTHPPSQPSSLPIYAPMSRSPPSSDRVSPYKPMNLNIPSGTSFASTRQHFGSPSDSGLSAGGSPPRSHFEQQIIDAKAQYLGSGNGTASQQRQSLMARFIPGQGIQYLPSHGNGGPAYNRSSTIPSPLSPTSSRSIQPQQPPFYPQQIQRRTSDAPQPNINDLGKGVPLSSVPASWPLFIVEFKAGRTDLFYLMDLSLDIRVGDLVIVEADRGKDLGKVVNDSITLEEVEAFQREQKERVGYGGDSGPLSPGGQQGSKKEINPKMIYGKAQPQDTQHLVTKIQDEMKALQLCQSKVRQKKLPMEVIDAEYQWDRRKLTFYFVAEKRIDFRELVRELFRLYKTRIWMASLQGPGGYEQ
ncbi:PSP1 C-terminal conserved region-domain-containing protein [Boletus reticuloceps]|uniref:PSP1 C-terminal conserved region-domain-containing protein n=1 Tax=Boletus reticuloceps TaxID=495285 RepID=A0A8I2YGY5_9AGAM|nr:PSP1 C-terminal conserved region-domain-containing protein [Boletus reticuloceps]